MILYELTTANKATFSEWSQIERVTLLGCASVFPLLIFTSTSLSSHPIYLLRQTAQVKTTELTKDKEQTTSVLIQTLRTDSSLWVRLLSVAGGLWQIDGFTPLHRQDFRDINTCNGFTWYSHCGVERRLLLKSNKTHSLNLFDGFSSKLLLFFICFTQNSWRKKGVSSILWMDWRVSLMPQK